MEVGRVRRRYQENEYKKDGLEQLKVFIGDAGKPAGNSGTGKNIRIADGKQCDYRRTHRPGKCVRRQQCGDCGLQNREAEERSGRTARFAVEHLRFGGGRDIRMEPGALVFHYLQNNQIQATTRDVKQLQEAQKLCRKWRRIFALGNFRQSQGTSAGLCLRAICPSHEEELSARQDRETFLPETDSWAAGK